MLHETTLAVSCYMNGLRMPMQDVRIMLKEADLL